MVTVTRTDGSADRRRATGVSASSVPPTVRRTPGRRRPTGAPPPLPRNIGRTGRAWIVGLVVLVAWMVVALFSAPLRRLTDRIDTAILRAVARLRTEWLVQAARAVDRVATGWVMFFVAIALIIATVGFKRWRHLFTFLGSVLVLEVLGILLIAAYKRPRPYDVTTIGRWRGYSLPVGAGGDRVVHRRRHHLHAGRARTLALDRQDPRHHRGRDLCRVADVPRRGPPLRRPGRRRLRSGDPAQRLPLLHAERGRAGDAARRQDGAPRCRRSARRGGATGVRRPTRRRGGRHQAGRSGRLGRLDAVAGSSRRRPRHLRLREALRDEPRAVGPLVQDRPHDPVRTPRGRGSRSRRSVASCSTRTTPCG